MEQQKKRRSENWSSDEKEILRQLITQSRDIIEDKSTKTSANIKKAKEWKNIAKKINELTGKNRADHEIKLAWKRMKLAAKAHISTHRQQQMRTGGGEKPKSPSPEDLAIMAIAPHDFVVELNTYDSDAVPTEIELNPEENIETVAGPSRKMDSEIILCEPSCEIEVIMDQGASEIHKVTPRKKPQKIQRKKSPQNIKEVMQEKILESNQHFKQKQLEMLEVEHQYNIEIAKLQIKKLRLEINLLENKKNSSSNN